MRRYQMMMSDSALWTGFPFRDDDVVISPPAKCGTSWMQMLCALLVFNSIRFPRRLTEISAVSRAYSEAQAQPRNAGAVGGLARVLHASGDRVVDEGIVPLEVFVDGEEDGVAVTLEFDAEETIRPVVYVRYRGLLHEEALPPHPLRRYEDKAYSDAFETLVRPLLG